MKPFVLECDITCFRALGVKIDEVGGCRVSNTGASNAILNCVYAIDSSDTKIESVAQSIIDNFSVQGLPHCWWTEVESEPLKLKEILQANGKKHLGEFAGMAIDVSEILEINAASDLTIESVSTREEFSTWGSIIAEAFEFSESDAELYTSLFARTGTEGPFYHLVGKRNGKVVSTGSILCTEEGAYLYNIATKVPERGKGYGRTITNALLEIAKRSKQTRIALVSSQSAAPIYQNLGFQEVCRFHIYA